MNRRITVTGILLALVLTAGFASAGEQWLHIKVEDRGYSDENVNINLPISMIEAILPMIDTPEFRGGMLDLRMHVDDDDFHGIDFRRVLEALRDAPDADFVTVSSDDENVRVAKADGMLTIHVDSRRDSEKVRVKIPLAVVDAMLGDDPYRIDLMAGLRTLADYGGGDLVTVESDDESVRIWIDDNQHAN